MHGTTSLLLKGHFDLVCYTPGNHDLWSRRGTDALEKLRAVRRCCADLGVRFGPVRLRGAQTVLHLGGVDVAWACEASAVAVLLQLKLGQRARPALVSSTTAPWIGLAFNDCREAGDAGVDGLPANEMA